MKWNLMFGAKTNLSGSCLCGAVTYTCTAKPILAVNCHCLDCKKASGSGYMASFFVKKEAITITGEIKYYEYQSASGNPTWRGFCPQCGSQLFGNAMPGAIAVRAGSLDDPAQYRPEMDVFTSRAPAWDCMDAALPKFETLPT